MIPSYFPAIALMLIGTASGLQSAPPAFDSRELAEYRLTPAVFARFQEASRLIVAVTRRDPRFATAPLFTRDIAVAGDAPVMAQQLHDRLQREPDLAAALRTARLAPREYTKFALALLAARLAQGFMDTGVLRRVPAGAPTENVAFVKAHQAEVLALLKDMGVD